MKAVIIAGGKGTRIAELYPDIPKPMIPIDGIPVLQREIECLRKQSISELIITVGYKADKIMNYFGNGENFGVNIEYFVEKTPLGNAGALLKIKEKLDGDFLLLNADSIFEIDLRRMIAFHKKTRGEATIAVHPNDHPFDSGLIVYDGNYKVTQWINREEPRNEYYRNVVNAGVHILSTSILDKIFKGEILDLDRDILKPLIENGTLYAYKTSEYIKDMGTPERLLQVKSDFKSNIPFRMNLLEKQKAIFLDRDGTINKYVGFLTNINDFELLPHVEDSIKEFHKLGYLVIVVTNQPVIARGEITDKELDKIHNKMETLLGEAGTYIDALYYCPHHPNKGYIGEIRELKVECECRKPKPGMLLKAAKDFNIDLSNSWMAGDSESDILAGKRAGCHTCLLGFDSNTEADVCCVDLYEFTKIL